MGSDTSGMGSEKSQEPGHVHATGEKVDEVGEKEAQRCDEAWDWWRRIGSPRYTCAPMVNNSELAFRRLVRSHGCQLTYSPMIVARKFVAMKSDEARIRLIEPDPADRPFIVQFAGDNPEDVLEAGRIIQRLGLADAIDINLGCPQPQAARDHYGSILMEEPELVERIVAAAAHGLAIPVTVKMRVFKDVDRTVAFARRMERAGASLLAVHGRTRAATHHEGECDWEAIRAVKAALRIPVVANGGPVRTRADADRCMEETGCDSVMCAIGLLLDPRLFSPDVPATPRDPVELAHEYLDYAEATPTTPSVSVRDHIQKLLRPFICPASFRRGGCTEEHRDLWSILCSNDLKHARQARAVVDWYTFREGHPLAPSTQPPSLKDIKRGWGALAKVSPAWAPCPLLQKGESDGEGAEPNGGVEGRFEEFANAQFELF